MKALKRSVIVMGAVCVLLGALLAFLLLWAPPAAVTSGETAVETFVDVPLSRLAAVMIENRKTSYAVMQTPAGPEVISRFQADYDDTQLKALLYAASHLSGSRKNTDASTFSNYGIDAPRATVTLVLADQSKRVVQVLAPNPVDGNVYLYDADGGAVYLASASVAELFLRDEPELMSHQPLPVRDVSDFSSIRSVEMRFAGQARDYTVTCADNGYYLTAPIRQRVPSTDVVSQLFLPMLSVYSDGVAELNADLSALGFDHADLRMTLTTGAGQTSLWFLRAEDGSCLMARPDNGIVYTVDPAVLQSLTFDYTLFTGGTAMHYGAGDLERLLFDLPDRQLIAQIGEENGQMTVTLDGRRLSREEANTFLSALNGIPIAGEAREPASLSAPVLTVTASLRTGGAEVTSFSPAVQGYSYLTVMGETHFVAETADVEAFAGTLTALADGRGE